MCAYSHEQTSKHSIENGFAPGLNLSERRVRLTPGHPLSRICKGIQGKLQMLIRDAVKEDAYDLARLQALAGDGIIEYGYKDLVAGIGPIELFARVFE